VRLRKLIPMRDALESAAYFGGLIGGDAWRAWRVLLIAIVGEELTQNERVVFEASQDALRSPERRLKSFGPSLDVAAARRALWPS
jgi:hypothetical protein